MKKFCLRNIPNDLHQRIKIASAQTGIPMNDMFRIAIEEYLERRDKK